MKIAILGAGAMGSIYGGFLSKNNEVWLVDIWKEHIDAINSEGLKIKEGGETLVFHPKAVSDAESVGVAELVIVFVKSINTAEALEQNKALFGDDTIVLSLQNGYGNGDDILKYVKADNLVLGTTAHGGNVLGPGYIHHAGRAKTFAGVPKGSNEKAKIVVEKLREAGFDAYVDDDVMHMIWKKLLANIAANPITSILKVRNGFMSDNADAAAIAEAIIREGVAVVNATGMSFNADDVVADVMHGSHLTANNKSSMLQDVLKKRKTEIERISGAIVAKGKEVGIPTPNCTMMLRMIRAMESTYNYQL